MSKWVTFYEDVIRNQIDDLHVHENKETAERYFKQTYKNYFELNTPITVKAPMSYGFPFRKYWILSKPSFEKRYLKEKKLEKTLEEVQGEKDESVL